MRIFLDLLTLVQSLAELPTHISKIVPGPPNFISFCDASTAGGGECSLHQVAVPSCQLFGASHFQWTLQPQWSWPTIPQWGNEKLGPRIGSSSPPHPGPGDTGPTKTSAHCRILQQYDRRNIINMSQFHFHYRIEPKEVKPWELDLWDIIIIHRVLIRIAGSRLCILNEKSSWHGVKMSQNK